MLDDSDEVKAWNELGRDGRWAELMKRLEGGLERLRRDACEPAARQPAMASLSALHAEVVTVPGGDRRYAELEDVRGD